MDIKERIAIKFCEASDIDFYTPYGRKVGNAFANNQIMPLIEKGGWIDPEKCPRCNAKLLC